MTEYLTTDEVAERYRTSPRNVRRWLAEGYGPKAVKIGRRWLYSLAELVRFERDTAAGTAATA